MNVCVYIKKKLLHRNNVSNHIFINPMRINMD